MKSAQTRSPVYEGTIRKMLVPVLLKTCASVYTGRTVGNDFNNCSEAFVKGFNETEKPVNEVVVSSWV